MSYIGRPKLYIYVKLQVCEIIIALNQIEAARVLIFIYANSRYIVYSYLQSKCSLPSTHIFIILCLTHFLTTCTCL